MLFNLVNCTADGAPAVSGVSICIRTTRSASPSTGMFALCVTKINCRSRFRVRMISTSVL